MEDKILLAHGSGGRMSHRLIEEHLVARLGNRWLERLDDSAVLKCSGKMCFTTDSYVVNPTFFPGGDIGRLSVCGTVNDLSVMGATPLFLSLGLILEEGLPVSDLDKILDSIADACREAGVSIVTGDTKVVPRGAADGIYINTSGIGTVPESVNISGSNARPGDAVILTGTIGDHGMAVLSQREGIKFSGALSSDCAPLNGLTTEMLGVTSDIHAMRDPTRGGVATTLNEIAACSGVGISIFETAIPVNTPVAALCDLLGLDPLYIANEGKLLVIAPPQKKQELLAAIKAHPLGREAAVIGEVSDDNPGKVTLVTSLGTRRLVTMLSGDILPRIC